MTSVMPQKSPTKTRWALAPATFRAACGLFFDLFSASQVAFPPNPNASSFKCDCPRVQAERRALGVSEDRYPRTSFISQEGEPDDRKFRREKGGFNPLKESEITRPSGPEPSRFSGKDRRHNRKIKPDGADAAQAEARPLEASPRS